MMNRKSRTRFRLVPKSTTLDDLEGYYAVAALAIDKAGPRPYHFRQGPTSGPAARPGS